MSKLSSSILGPWIRRFLLEHLVGECNLARNTRLSYRDALTKPVIAVRVTQPA
jgi:integrase/recombinase XerD